MRNARLTALTGVAAFTIGIGLFAATPANAAPVTTTIAGITYTADDTAVPAGASVTAFDGSTTTVTIPDVVTIGGETYAVTRIASPGGGDGVFKDMGITDVTLGQNLIEVGSYAFFDNHLTNVVIPDAVTHIGVNAFGSARLDTVTLGSSVTDIAYGAFASNSLTSVTLPASVTNVGSYAFVNNSALSAVEFTGPAPSITEASGVQSFDPTVTGFMISYPEQYGEPTVPGGYTTPTWKGYPTTAIPDGSVPPTPELTISKTVDASYVRVHRWDFEKAGAVERLTVSGDIAAADVAFTVTATPVGAENRYHSLSGEITVTNEWAEPAVVTVTDAASVGVDATCRVYDPSDAPAVDVTVPAHGAVVFSYRCSLSSGTPADGTNTATVTWGAGQSASATVAVVFAQRGESFATIHVLDDHADSTAPGVELGEATWNADGMPTSFRYTLPIADLPVGECTEVTNNAWIAETEQSAEATVAVCPEAKVVPAPSVPEEAGGLATTGSEIGPLPMIGGGLLLGGMVLLIGRRLWMKSAAGYARIR